MYLSLSVAYAFRLVLPSFAFFRLRRWCCRNSFSFFDKIFKVYAIQFVWMACRDKTEQTNSIQYILFISLDKFMSSHKLLCLLFHKLRVAECNVLHNANIRSRRPGLEKLNGAFFCKASASVYIIYVLCWKSMNRNKNNNDMTEEIEAKANQQQQENDNHNAKRDRLWWLCIVGWST